MKIIQLHVWMQNKSKSWETPEVPRGKDGHPSPGKRIVLEPESQNIISIKLQIAKELAKYRRELLNYYVVVVVERSDGTPGYRTIVPKVVFNDNQ
jgi:hypothetical protein